MLFKAKQKQTFPQTNHGLQLERIKYDLSYSYPRIKMRESKTKKVAFQIENGGKAMLFFPFVLVKSILFLGIHRPAFETSQDVLHVFTAGNWDSHFFL